MQGYLKPELKQAIRKAFLDVNDPAVLKSFRVEGFSATDDKAYDILRETAKILELNLAKMG
jgi:phosphonate transport system substrate-binding protein